MKYLKMAALVAVAATALIAFVGVSTASATVACRPLSRIKSAAGPQSKCP